MPSHGVAVWLGKASQGQGEAQLGEPASQDEPPWDWGEGGDLAAVP